MSGHYHDNYMNVGFVNTIIMTLPLPYETISLSSRGLLGGLSTNSRSSNIHQAVPLFRLCPLRVRELMHTTWVLPRPPLQMQDQQLLEYDLFVADIEYC